MAEKDGGAPIKLKNVLMVQILSLRRTVRFCYQRFTFPFLSAFIQVSSFDVFVGSLGDEVGWRS